MNTFTVLKKFVILTAFVFATPTNADIFQWSNNEIQYLHGDGYQAPFNSNDVSQSIMTVTHSDGWEYGRNFFFVDTLITERGQPAQTEIYGEAYSTFSVSKIIGKDLSFAIFKDINATVGVNGGENFESKKSGSRVALYGVTVDFDIPGFKFLNVDFLNHVPFEPTAQGASLQITPVWNLPFTIAGTKWIFEGFTDFIGSKKSGSAFTILSQPQLRLDIGDLAEKGQDQ